MKASSAFQEALSLANRGLDFNTVMDWPSYMRKAALEMFLEAEKKDTPKGPQGRNRGG